MKKAILALLAFTAISMAEDCICYGWAVARYNDGGTEKGLYTDLAKYTQTCPKNGDNLNHASAVYYGDGGYEFFKSLSYNTSYTTSGEACQSSPQENESDVRNQAMTQMMKKRAGMDWVHSWKPVNGYSR